MTELTNEQQQAMRFMGFLAGLFSKACLEAGGCEVDFRINGEHINDIRKLYPVDIHQRIKLAVAEERYEDAAKLHKLLP